MAYELAEQLDWQWPDWIVYPTGGGTGMVGMWKAFDELERIGWVPQASGRAWCRCRPENCAPIVRAFQQGTEKADRGVTRTTIAGRLARAARDWRLPHPRAPCATAAARRSPSPTVRWSTACCQSASTKASAPLRRRRGHWRHRAARVNGTIARHESVVLFNTGALLSDVPIDVLN
jgi:threonine synthase